MTPRLPLRAVFGLGRQFNLLFASGLLSSIGSFTTQTALLLHVYRLSSHNAAYLGLVALCDLAPFVLASPLSGILAERYNRKWIMLANELLRIPLVLLLWPSNSVWLLFILQALISTSSTLAQPARKTLLPQTVRIESLALANTLNGGMLSILHVLGPVLGALLYARSGSLSLVVIIEAIACAGAALLLSLLDQTATQPTLPTVRPAFLTEFWKGVHYVRTTPDLRQILTMLAMSGIANGLFTPLLRPLVEESLHGDDALYAKMFSVFGIGGMLGPLIGFYAGRYFGLGRVLLAAFVIEAVLLTLLSRAHSPQLGTVIMLLWGMNEFAMLPCYMSYVHLRTEPAMMGRTFALFEQVEYIPQLAAAALVGILAGRLPAQGILTVAGVGYLILVMLTLPSQGSRMLAARGHLTSDKDGANGDADS